jgi:hypothetical protein
MFMSTEPKKTREEAVSHEIPDSNLNQETI